MFPNREGSVEDIEILPKRGPWLSGGSIIDCDLGYLDPVEKDNQSNSGVELEKKSRPEVLEVEGSQLCIVAAVVEFRGTTDEGSVISTSGLEKGRVAERSRVKGGAKCERLEKDDEDPPLPTEENPMFILQEKTKRMGETDDF